MRKHHNLNIDKVYVLHVQKGGEARARHMEDMLSGLGIDFEYMFDGDIDSITPERQKRFFPNSTPNRWNSCAMKHLLVYQKMLDQGLKRVLVLEDDAILRSDFIKYFNRAIEELDANEAKNQPQLAFFEATHLWFVPVRCRRWGQVLYSPRSLQCLACYTLNAECAKSIIEAAEAEKSELPIDMYIEKLWRRGVIPNLYQSQPDLCRQGSHVGQFKSLIGNPLSAKKNAEFKYKARYIFHKYVSVFFR